MCRNVKARPSWAVFLHCVVDAFVVEVLPEPAGVLLAQLAEHIQHLLCLLHAGQVQQPQWRGRSLCGDMDDTRQEVVSAFI